MIKRILQFIAILLLCSQCVQVYVPNTRNVPLFSKRGEVEGTAKFGPLGSDFQAAAAVTNHVALMAGYAHYDWALQRKDYKRNDESPLKSRVVFFYYFSSTKYYTSLALR